jgi:hypothetical protein
VTLPALRLDQHDPGRLHEQDAQVAIAALGYLAEVCADVIENYPCSLKEQTLYYVKPMVLGGVFGGK